MLNSENKSGKKRRIDATIDTGIIKSAKEIMKRKYKEDNFSGLIEWLLDKWIQDEKGLDILDNLTGRGSPTDIAYQKWVKKNIGTGKQVDYDAIIKKHEGKPQVQKVFMFLKKAQEEAKKNREEATKKKS